MNEEQANKMIELLSDIKDQLVILKDRVEAVEKVVGIAGDYTATKLDTISTKLETLDKSIGTVNSSISSLEMTITLKD